MGAYSGRAADLPEGSVVANAGSAWIKRSPGTSPWRSTAGIYVPDELVDEALSRGADVLRVGDGR